MFNYLRPLSVLSLFAVILIAILAGDAIRNTASDDLLNPVGKNNTNLAQGYINTVWKKYRDTVVPLARHPEQLQGNPQVMAFAEDTAHYFQNMALVRVNVYDAEGLLLMTTDIDNAEKLQGEEVSPDNKFVSAHRQQKDSASQVVNGVLMQNSLRATLIQTVVPLRAQTASGAMATEGALEIMYNISDPWDRVLAFQVLGTGGIMVSFTIFYALLTIAARRADTIIAEQHETNIELEAAAAAAQAENKDKSQFLANISHELRTPLNAIIGFSNIIRTEVMPGIEDKKYHDYINDIHSSGVHLLSLINDILDYSKAEAGKLALEVSEISVNKALQNSMRLVTPRAEAGQVNLVEQLPKEQYVMVTDSKKFKQVMLNLLSNAVKFTPPGGSVYVSVWHNMVDDTYSFEVRDTGIGIAPKDISRAMAAFGQIDNTLKRKYEGTGLGLPLTKKFVEIMGGKFNIESQVNVGTKITFSLPREVKGGDGVIVKQEA